MPMWQSWRWQSRMYLHSGPNHADVCAEDYQIALHAELHIDIVTTQQARLGQQRRGEADEHILERIAAARQRPLPEPSQHDGVSDHLMVAAIRQLDMSTSPIARVWRITAVIAQLGGQDMIGAAHLAEALQYRGRHEVQPKAAA